MRHGNAFRKFSRTSSHRKAMLMNLAQSLLKHDRIETTLAKAKDLRRVSEKLITLGRNDTLHRRRQAYSYLTDKSVVAKLFDELGPIFKDRPGGYTRIVKTRNRAGDAAPMAIIELVKEAVSPKAKKAKSRNKNQEQPKQAQAAVANDTVATDAVTPNEADKQES